MSSNTSDSLDGVGVVPADAPCVRARADRRAHALLRARERIARERANSVEADDADGVGVTPSLSGRGAAAQRAKEDIARAKKEIAAARAVAKAAKEVREHEKK